MNDRKGERATQPSTPALIPAAISDDLWAALYRDRPTACTEHSAWADHCRHLHQRADEQLAVAS